jgi:hypothetical protein
MHLLANNPIFRQPDLGFESSAELYNKSFLHVKITGSVFKRETFISLNARVLST